MKPNFSDSLPHVLAGPVLRRIEAHRLVLWLMASRPLSWQLILQAADITQTIDLTEEQCQSVQVGHSAWLYLIDVHIEQTLPSDILIHYDLQFKTPQGKRGVCDWGAHLLYPGHTQLNFVRRTRVDNLLHGSCRKPHHPSADGLCQADALLLNNAAVHERPALLMLSGDQIYADDVAGPMLTAIHALIARLGLFHETLEGAEVTDSLQLYQHADCYYQREALLPACKANDTLRDRFFGGTKKPIFTSSNAHNHLMTLSEVLAMYLLVWSPVPWQLIQTHCPLLPAKKVAQYHAEEAVIRNFVASLPSVARALAHLPTLMIFDDHDITDDWNLSAEWEQTAYGHPFSRRIVGNALLGYLLCQGWGNNPDAFRTLLPATQQLFSSAAYFGGFLNQSAQDALISQLFSFRRWGYCLPTSPSLIVLDTRTQRWRSESQLSNPSGLMDWEALCELQEMLLDKPSAIIVSPAPMFGVKLIEVIQRLFTMAGQALMVDAENWMAHPGAAMVMLSIFSHSRTPANYVILSGDVHYSFAYEVHIRNRDSGPHLWQITSSGIKNEFPSGLLTWFDRLNRWLYAPQSPLNWLTRRRHLLIDPCRPDRAQRGERLWNQAGLGQLLLDKRGSPRAILQHCADGSTPVHFLPASDT